ncbi:MAG TPA: Mrp/NBP35 family ATP-binding protein [Longimicrobium sp.]|jgi:ATP-binding protein involved in chromosome partitioning|uniref:Mrp/NBP35 family ATP-binding protein n=1 Tax=Longimicrobium sp. TaxID=2029185 RepID=UPI002ED93B27
MQASERDQVLRRVAAALTLVLHPTTGDDVVSSGRVRELDVLEDGTVRFKFALQADDPGTLVRQARAAAETVEGVAKVKIDIALPAAGAPQKKGALRAGNVPAPTPNPNLIPGVRQIIAVSSGKGGVGKSTVAVNVAAALAKSGRRVGLLDADIYGPNVPIMFGEKRKPSVVGPKGKEKMQPLEAYGVQLMSLGFLLDAEQPAIMRGPMIAGILKQFLSEVEWGELDVLVVDMPPGTGDAQLSLVQTIRLDGVVMVTTPQDVSTGDVLRGIKMFERTNTRVLGIVENMAGFICPCCGQRYEIFGRAGGQRLAEQTGLELLGEVPLEMIVREGGDEGVPVVIGHPESPSAMALRALAETVASRLEPLVPAAV